MTGDQARAEIKAIESDPSFAGDGKMDHWSRQGMLKRRDALYKRAAPSPEEAARLKEEEEARSKESLEREIERYELRDALEAEKTLEEKLIRHFGDEKTASEKVKSAQALVKKYITNPRDLQFLDDSGLGNDFEVIGMVARLNEILTESRSRMRKSKKGGAMEMEKTELTRRGGK
jgi:hypothetical protein